MGLPIFGAILVTLTAFNVCTSQKFDPTYTGVSFTPYTMSEANNYIPSPSDYTTEDIHAMLEVIQEKFSRVVTLEAGYNANTGSYIRNKTYYEKSEPVARIAEVAAKINLKSSNRNISVLQGVWFHNEPGVEIQLAIEAAEKANKIYPGTVDGLVLSHWQVEYQQRAELVKTFQAYIRNSTVGHLKFGIWTECEKLFDRDEDDEKLLNSTWLDTDFVICKIYPKNKMMKKGPVEAFESIVPTLLEYRRKFNKVNSNLVVMAETKWASSGKDPWNSVKNLQKYWETAGKWAKENTFPIWFFEAIDNPGRKIKDGIFKLDAWCGWWELTDNSKKGKREGYIQKILNNEIERKPRTTEIPVRTSATVSTSTIVSITVALVVITILVAAVVFLYMRGQKLQQKLSKLDIREFMEGMSELAMRQNDHGLDNFALKLPYDRSLEINKGRLSIDFNKILGVGQFGCVYNAVIESNTGSFQHVALKTSKQDCPRSALKGLLSEIKIMMHIGNHKNVVTLKGAYTEHLQKGIVYIATELCSLGSLEAYLRKHVKTAGVPLEPGQITFTEMIKWSQEIACGMEYLGVKNVVHADLASRNVLLNEHKTAKISDFGLSRRMYNYTNYVKTQQEPLPWRWMAIESLKRCEFSAKSDVWSFGITLWEIFSMGDSPYPGLSWTNDFVDTLVNGLRLTRPKYATSDIYKLMTDCWHTEADERPDFSNIQNTIENISVESTDTAVRSERYVNSGKQN